MPSLPQLKNVQSSSGEMPFASYAQLVRMLVPPVQRVGFYDAKGRALWTSDGVEEPEFRMHLELVLARFAANRPDEMPGPYSASEQPEPIYVFPIRDQAKVLLGAVGMVCRELPSSAAYRRFEHVERLLGPLIDILEHGWQSQQASIPTPALDTKGDAVAAPAAKRGASAPLPALLRRALALATRSLDCAFGAVVAVERPFTLTHRVSPDESDLAINAAIDSVRASVLNWMKTRDEPLLFNSPRTGGAQPLPFKLLALPLKAGPSQLAATIILFRAKHARDFVHADLAALAQISVQVPAEALSELIPKQAESAQGTAAERPAKTEYLDGNAAQPKRSARHPQPKPQAAPPTAAPSAPASPIPVSPNTRAPSQTDTPTASRSAAPTPGASPHSFAPIAVARVSMSMEERVREALREDGFDLFVQKISPLRNTQRAERFEILLRMKDGGTLRSPHAFFGAAEAGELMPDVDKWVFKELLARLRTRAIALRTMCWEFSINVAAQSLLTDRFSDFVLSEIGKSSIPAGLLVFEVSEGDAIEHQYSLSILTARLHQIGCRIALDNCRAGLRTFDSVRKWPVSCLKIDGSLIRNVVGNYRYETQVRAVAKLANEMGIETIAECVENENTCDKLIDMGLDYAQGFHFERPRPLETLFGSRSG